MLTYEVQPDILDEVRRSMGEVSSKRESIRNVVMKGPATTLRIQWWLFSGARPDGRRHIFTVELMNIWEVKGPEDVTEAKWQCLITRC